VIKQTFLHSTQLALTIYFSLNKSDWYDDSIQEIDSNIKRLVSTMDVLWQLKKEIIGSERTAIKSRKLHSILHYPFSIRLYGPPSRYDTSSDEMHHKRHLKGTFRQTSQRKKSDIKELAVKTLHNRMDNITEALEKWVSCPSEHQNMESEIISFMLYGEGKRKSDIIISTNPITGDSMESEEMESLIIRIKHFECRLQTFKHLLLTHYTKTYPNFTAATLKIYTNIKISAPVDSGMNGILLRSGSLSNNFNSDFVQVNIEDEVAHSSTLAQIVLILGYEDHHNTTTSLLLVKYLQQIKHSESNNSVLLRLEWTRNRQNHECTFDIIESTMIKRPAFVKSSAYNTGNRHDKFLSIPWTFFDSNTAPEIIQ